MSVLLKGYKMPKTCMNAGCPVDGKYCLLWWKAGPYAEEMRELERKEREGQNGRLHQQTSGD